jgi:ABC-2 type transport system ATP-binding protein
MTVLSARDLTKRYGRTVAVDKLTFEVGAGELFGLLGPNGAGKTTFMAMAMGLARPTSGALTVLGEPSSRVVAIHRRAGALIEEPRFYPNFSARLNLKMLARPHGREALRRIDPLLERVGLLARAREKVSRYSQGMRQRLGLAATLLADPELLILDEPTNALDPAGADEMWSLLRELARERGKTVMVSSHLLREVEEHCSAAAVLNRGRLVACGPMSDLLARAEASAPTWCVALGSRDQAEKAAALVREKAWGEPGDIRESSDLAPGAWEFEIEPAADGDWRASDLAKALVDAGLPPEGLAARRLTLKDLFRRLTSESPEVQEPGTS